MNDFPELDMDAAALGGVVGVVLIIYLVILLFASIFGIISYILTSLGTYSIANRRGIKNAWLAWVPVGSSWIVGCISDQYQQVAKGKNTRRRVLLLVLYFATVVMSTIYMGLSISEMIQMIAADHISQDAGSSFGMTSALFSLVMSAASIAYSILYYFCLYDLYNSCKPENSVLYLVLTILLGVVTPFLIFSCRNKDQGMPTPQPQYQAPVYGQQPTWQSVQNYPYQPQQPDYQPYQPQPQLPQQPAEPWEQQDGQ
jgi:hypothetical protein